MAEKRRTRENYRKLDNTTKARKIEIRRKALGFLERPVVMETHGGFGAIWRDCYANIPAGVVFEKDPKKTAALAEQRPTWAVYEADCENAIAAGVGFHLPINYFDFDPYGSPWPVIQALFSRPRVDWPARIVLVANDGYRLAIKLDGGKAGIIAPFVERYGSGRNLYDHYLEICRAFIEEKSGPHGFSLTHWGGYYCGFSEQMTHYAAVLDRSP